MKFCLCELRAYTQKGNPNLTKSKIRLAREPVTPLTHRAGSGKPYRSNETGSSLQNPRYDSAFGARERYRRHEREERKAHEFSRCLGAGTTPNPSLKQRLWERERGLVKEGDEREGDRPGGGEYEERVWTVCCFFSFFFSSSTRWRDQSRPFW